MNVMDMMVSVLVVWHKSVTTTLFCLTNPPNDKKNICRPIKLQISIFDKLESGHFDLLRKQLPHFQLLIIRIVAH